MPLEYFNSLGAMMQLITFVVVGVVHSNRDLSLSLSRGSAMKFTNIQYTSAIFTGLLGTMSDTIITTLCTRNDGWVRQ
jgi:hypothetical protein